MPTLRSSMRRFLRNWKTDMARPWQSFLDNVEPAFQKIDERLEMGRSTIFPGRKDREPRNAPEGSHVLRAFDRINPGQVKVVIIGQDPYPNVRQATGRAFEQGDQTEWTSDIANSLKRIIQVVAHDRTGNRTYKQSRGGWGNVKSAIESGELELQEPTRIFGYWQRQGVLWLNTALTLTKFHDPHQTRGHIPLWKPVIQEIVLRLAQRPRRQLVVVAWGGKAKDFLVACNLLRKTRRRGKPVYVETKAFEHAAVVQASHPSIPGFLSGTNPLTSVNRKLVQMGATSINW